MSRSSWHRGRVQFTAADRRTILRREPICVACHRRPSTVADHRVPVAEDGANTVDNGQGMCDPCHTAKTKQEQARGLARRPSRRRPQEQHPGLIT